MTIYEIVYKDGMTHSSYNYQLIQEIMELDKDLISHLNTRQDGKTYIQQ